MKVDSAILETLSLTSDQASMASAGAGGDSSARPFKITATLHDGSSKNFFVKTGHGRAAEIMFKGEHASLTALHRAVPSLCPASFGHGSLREAPAKYFLVTDYLELGATSGASGGLSLAQKMATLHTTPAPIPDGYDQPMFGFPEVTCCGDTPQPNDWNASWADFYAEKRLRFILRQSEKSNGADPELHEMVTATADVVVPRLLGDKHLNHGKGVVPVAVHGDLWSGNAAVGRIDGQGDNEHVVYDSSACYAHSEYDLGIMRMFGGFGSSFFREYHQLCPETEPVDEYDDRVALYELYHHLNHHAMFGGGYRSGAMSIMKRLRSRYGKESEL